MKQPPEIPTIESAPPELLASGHLWILEAVVGSPLRFRLQNSGIIEFGDGERVYASGDELPPQYQHAVRHICSRLDREALRAAVDDPSAIIFFGTAMQYQGVEYDWERTPSFLGQEVWSATNERFRPPDAVDGIYERLGLQAVTPLEQELPARDFDPDRYEIPQSTWYDGPAAGVVIRDKQGHRARLSNPDVGDVESTSSSETAPLETPLPEATETAATESTKTTETGTTESTAAALAATYGSDTRLRRLAEELRQQGRTVTDEQLFQRAVASGYRELNPRVFGPTGPVDRRAFRSELAALTGQFVQE